MEWRGGVREREERREGRRKRRIGCRRAAEVLDRKIAIKSGHPIICSDVIIITAGVLPPVMWIQNVSSANMMKQKPDATEG